MFPRMTRASILLGVTLVWNLAGCDPPRARPALHIPEGTAYVILPADQMSDELDDDDDEMETFSDEATTRQPSVTYVRIEDWEPLPEVKKAKKPNKPERDLLPP
jgi:hypothetical protein